MFFLVWKLSSKSLSRAPVRQHAAVMILKKTLAECKIVASGELLQRWPFKSP